MKRNLLLASRLREVFLDGKWIANTNYKEQLQGLSWQQAIQKMENFNSIAALTFHINYYLDGLLKAFDSGKLEINDKFSFDVAPIESQENWEMLVSELLSHANKFVEWVEKMEERKLDEPFLDKKYGSLLRNIEGVIEHSYYHLGQISLLRKMSMTQTSW